METPLQSAPSLYATRKKDRRRIERLWDRFQSRGDDGIDTHDAYMRLLWSDWIRCLKLGVSPAMSKGVVLPEEEFEKRLKQGRFLLDLSKPILGYAQSLLSNVPGIIILADESATILEVIGNARVKERAESDSNIAVGSQWKEEYSGTNGIGTAITKAAPVHVYSSEHFCEGWHKWTCAATPILDPFNGRILGVVDFTTIESDYRDSSVALTYALSGQIQREILLKLSREHCELRRYAAEHYAAFDPEALYICDRFGNVLIGHNTVDRNSSRPLINHIEELPANLKSEVHDVEIKESSGNPILGKIYIGQKPAQERVSLAVSRKGRFATKCFGDFLTCDDHLKKQLYKLERVIGAGLSIFLQGETGTGKEILARYIHEQSRNASGPFVPVNCGSISRELFESRFFGYEKGAFTGADPKGRRGFFEQAHGGTLFLDEIGELPFEMQVGLLRVLETRKFRRLGSEEEVETDCIVVSATNRPLAEAINEGSFRSDLYYRLNMFSLSIPPIRERKHDIPILAEYIAKAHCAQNRLGNDIRFAEGAMTLLLSHSWPGNIRELKNTIISAIALRSDDTITAEELQQLSSPASDGLAIGSTKHVPTQLSRWTSKKFPEIEKMQIIEALKRFDTVTRICRELGMSRSTLYRRLHQYGIDHRDYKA